MRPVLSPLLVSVFACALALLGCSQHTLVDAAMSSAYRPPAPSRARDGLLVLAGDMHCHVVPPDPPGHVDRGLPETIAIARQEGLDFVLLTPHVRARFFADPARRASVVESQRALGTELGKQELGNLIALRGIEYTDFEYGHLTMGFADLEETLASLPVEEARAHPELFVRRWIEHGGIVAINHPVLTPLPSMPFRAARGDLSWRPFLEPGPFPPEIAAATHEAQGIETFNLAVTHMRDGLLLGDRDRSMRHASYLLARRARLDRRRITAIGGSDSHTHHLRAATYVLAEARSPAANRDAILRGRTCVRSPEACSFEARDKSAGAWEPVGSSLHSARIEVRAEGQPIVILRDGVVVARPRSGEVVAIDTDASACSVLYAQVGEGFSSPIYAGCPF